MEKAKTTIKFTFSAQIMDEIKHNDANDANKLVEQSSSNIESNATSSTADNIPSILIYPPPHQAPGGITIHTEDYKCLAADKYINDVIIDFYLTYLQEELLSSEQLSRTHVFSSFFYERLTRIREIKTRTGRHTKLYSAQLRHENVTNWTRRINLFEKDYIIVPINKEEHWFLVIICFPGLYGPVTYDGLVPVTPVKRKKRAKVKNVDSIDGIDEALGDYSDASSDGEEDDLYLQTIKQPCILIFDSLAADTSKARVAETLRDYLTCEYRSKFGVESCRVFNKDTMPNYTLKVPQQKNFTDCGVYVLQYVEQFFADPMKDYRLSAMNNQVFNWFDPMTVTRKREVISILLKKLVKQYNPENLPLPDITLPTLHGELIKTDEMEQCLKEERKEVKCKDGVSNDRCQTRNRQKGKNKCLASSHSSQAKKNQNIKIK